MSQLAPPLLLFTLVLVVNAYSDRFVEPLAAELGVNSAKVLVYFLRSLIWLSGAWLTTRLINSLLLNPIMGGRGGSPAPRILANSVGAIVFVLTVFGMVRYVFDRPVTGLIATSGVVTIIIGFAIREMIADFFSGIAMNTERPYRIGDYLELEPGLVGRVTELNWRSTRLVTQSNKVVIIPNSNLASRQFINYSLPTSQYRESMELILNFTTDPRRAENILLAAMLASKGLVEHAPHSVKIKSFGERGVCYELRFFLHGYADRANAIDVVARNVLHHLQQAGIPIPYGQQEIFLTRERPRRREVRLSARRLLARIPWLDALNEGELDALAADTIEREFKPGEVIVTEGEPGNSLFVLVEGTLEASTNSNNQREERIGTIKPGQALGEMSFLTGEPRGATVRALTDAYVLQLQREAFEPIVRARPEIAEQLGKIMAKRVMKTQAAMESAHSSDADDFMSRAGQIARSISSLFGL
ncbi:MAG: mechanosensitive ion channel [Gammaproteobacteria bacterium]|nr:mechanosensitive ion channel [Gammaproteobacteria bacterium]